MEVKILNEKEKEATRWLYEEAFFEDSKSFVDYYYNYAIKKNIVTGLYHESLLSMIQLHPMVVDFSEQEVNIYYMIAVATKLSERKKGYYKHLLDFTLKNLYSDKIPFVFLKPAAVGIYYPFGFRIIDNIRSQIFNKNKTKVDFCEAKSLTNDDFIRMNNFLKGYTHIVQSDVYNIPAQLKAQRGGIYRASLEGEILGYIRYTNDDKPLIQDIISLQKHKRLLAGGFADYKNIPSIEVELSKAIGDIEGENHLIFMYRIVNLENFISILRVEKDIDITFKVLDNLIPENNICIRLTSNDGYLMLEKINYEADEIDIAELLEYLLDICITYDRHINEVI